MSLYRIDSSEPDLNFPSSSNEQKGYWVGFADNQGDSLTWRILTEDTHKIIIHSGIRSALRTTTNQRLASPSGEETTLPFPIPYPQQSRNSLPLDPLDASTPNIEQPRKGHLDRAKRIVGYLLFLPDGAIRFRTGEPDFSSLKDQEYDWTRSVYSGACEQIPHDIPKPLGKHVQTTHYVDANLHHDLATGKAVTAVLHFLNQTPIDAYTKRQSTVETATYGSEFVAARTAVDQIIDIRTTL